MRALRLAMLAAAPVLTLACGSSDGDADGFTPKPSLSLTFAGDIMAHEVNFTQPPYGAIYDEVRDILKADDYSFANLEFSIDDSKPMTGSPKEESPLFNIHSDYIQAAIDGGFDVFSNANNHSCDHGAASVSATIRAMKTLSETTPIYYSGMHEASEKDFAVTTIQHGPWKIGYLAVTGIMNENDGVDMVNRILYKSSEAKRKAFITYLESVTPDYDMFILSAHVGTEYLTEPAQIQKEFFLEILKAGVTIIWGNHPHVLQPWEKVVVNGSNRLIMHSVGNFISGQVTEINLAKPEHIKSGTAVSALFGVQVSMPSKGNFDFKVDPKLIANYPKQSHVTVRNADGLLDDQTIPRAWLDFFGKRIGIARQTVAEGPVITAP